MAECYNRAEQIALLAQVTAKQKSVILIENFQPVDYTVAMTAPAWSCVKQRAAGLILFQCNLLFPSSAKNSQ
jgi:hypothetical protein